MLNSKHTKTSLLFFSHKTSMLHLMLMVLKPRSRLNMARVAVSLLLMLNMMHFRALVTLVVII